MGRDGIWRDGIGWDRDRMDPDLQQHGRRIDRGAAAIRTQSPGQAAARGKRPGVSGTAAQKTRQRRCAAQLSSAQLRLWLWLWLCSSSRLLDNSQVSSSSCSWRGKAQGWGSRSRARGSGEKYGQGGRAAHGEARATRRAKVYKTK